MRELTQVRAVRALFSLICFLFFLRTHTLSLWHSPSPASPLHLSPPPALPAAYVQGGTLEPPHTRGGWDYGHLLVATSGDSPRLPLVCPTLPPTEAPPPVSPVSVSPAQTEKEEAEKGSEKGSEGPRCAAIDVVATSALKKGSFRRDYFARQRPVLVTGGLAARQVHVHTHPI